MVKGRGLLITFSGLDGAGKSTQIEWLKNDLQQRGYVTRTVWARGGYTPGIEGLKRLARRLLRRKLPPSGHSAQRSQTFGKSWVRWLWLSLAILDLIWVYSAQLRWWKWRGQAVICDRYVWDTLIDFRLNFPHEGVERWLLWRLLIRSAPKPDAAFVMLIPVEESLRRSDLKGEPFRDSADVLSRRLQQYQLLLPSNKWDMLNGNEPVEALAEIIQHTLGLIETAN
jgi:thymidylate kinase